VKLQIRSSVPLASRNNYDRHKKTRANIVGVNISMIGAKSRPGTSRISALKDIHKGTVRDHSDPTRRKVNLFEIKPNERPTSKIEALKKENKDLFNMLETNKKLIKELYENSSKEREKVTLYFSALVVLAV
jgi:hypothetical protein